MKRKRTPAMVWPLASFLAEEMEARGWTCIDVAKRMPGDYTVNIGIINFTLAVQDEGLLIDEQSVKAFAAAFDVSPDYIAGLDQLWRDNPQARMPFECPEHLLDGMVFPENDNEEARNAE